MSHVAGDDFYIEHQMVGHWEYVDLRQKILETAMKDGPTVPIVLEEEPGSGGKNQIAAIEDWMNDICDRKNIPRFQISGWRPDNDRVVLANVWFAEASKGKVYLVQGDWNEEFLDELAGFPIAPHDDRITSVTGARMNVAPIKLWSSPEFLSL
jgi:phage terminase large subunit-like protein